MNKICFILFALLVVLLGHSACRNMSQTPQPGAGEDERLPSRGVVVGVDITGSYEKTRPAAFGIIRDSLIPQLQEGDCLTVIPIAGRSFTDSEIVADCLPATDRPLDASNAVKVREKRAEWQKKIEAFSPTTETITDIYGGVSSAGLVLNRQFDEKWLLIFSDLLDNQAIHLGDQPELLKGVRVRVYAIPKDGTTPVEYARRLAHWDAVFRRHGADDIRYFGVAETRLLHNLLQ